MIPSAGSSGSTGLARVSVVMPVYDGARFLAEAIESVIAQTYADWELIVIDDGSRDASFEIAQAYADKDARIRALRNERNLGIVKTRNRAFAEAGAQTEYFAVLDADDVCIPERLAAQVAFLDANPDHAVVGGNTLIIDEHSRVVGHRLYPSSHTEIARVITRYNPMAQPTCTIRRAALAQTGVYDERYPRCQDYDLWLRMAARFKIANLPAFTLKYRVSATQGKAVHLRDSLRYTIAIQREWLLDPRFRRPENVVFFGLEHALLALPDPAILALFKWMTYRRQHAGA